MDAFWWILDLRTVRNCFLAVGHCAELFLRLIARFPFLKRSVSAEVISRRLRTHKDQFLALRIGERSRERWRTRKDQFSALRIGKRLLGRWRTHKDRFLSLRIGERSIER